MGADTFQFLKVDYSSQRDALVARSRSQFPGTWNDYQASNFGRVLIDLMSANTATLAYTVNRRAGENFLPTATMRESAVRIGALVGYALRSATSASVPADASLSSPAPADVTLAKGTAVRSGDSGSIPFELDADYTIPAGQTSPLASVVIFDPQQSGPRIIQSLIGVTLNAAYADCLDTTINLTDYVEAGQQLVIGSSVFQITGIEPIPGGVTNSRMLLASAWTSATTSVTATVIDRRVFFAQGQTQGETISTPASGTDGFVVKLNYSPVISNSVSVSVNGIAWTQVDDIILAGATDTSYQVRTLATGETLVMFGDGTFGALLPTEAVLELSYRTGGGSSGNIATGAINTSIIGLVTSLSNPVTVSVVNNQSGVGGLDAETLEEARLKIPASARTAGQAVTFENYATLATSFSDARHGQVRYARAGVRGGNTLVEGNVVIVYAWTTGTGGSLVPLNASLKAALQQYLQSKAVGTDYVVVGDGSQFDLPYSIRFKSAAGYSASDVETLLIDQLRAYVSALKPGDTVVYSKLFSQLIAVQGVDSLVIATPTTDVVPPSSNSIFVPPTSGVASYNLALQSPVAGEYTAQSPAVPLAPWCFSLVLDGHTITALPDVEPGRALLVGTVLSTLRPSYADLLTGAISLQIDGPAAELAIKLNTVQGYDNERKLDIYASYSGDLTQAKRREIRARLRGWVEGFAVGQTIYASAIGSASASVSNAEGVIAAVSGVSAVGRVSFDSPTNPSPRVDPTEFDRVVVRDVYLNNAAD